MKTSSGGTNMWCPNCKSIRTCRAVPGAQVTLDADDYAQRRYHSEHSDLNWFQRGRECLTCGFRFLTGEIRLRYLFELVELRNALADLKQNAEQYLEQSAEASATLNALNKSLGVLKALRLYQES